MTTNPSIAALNRIAEDIASAMSVVATQIALLGVEGDADEQMRVITAENNKVLDHIRQLYHLPPAGEG